MKIDEISIPTGRFVARVYAVVATSDRRPGSTNRFIFRLDCLRFGFGVPLVSRPDSAHARITAIDITQQGPSPTRPK